MKTNILLFISLIISLGLYSKEDNKSPNVRFVFLGDVSYSMKNAYNNNALEDKSGKIYDLFEDTTNRLSSENKRNVLVSGILFGTRKSKIADLVALTDLANNVFNFQKIYEPKKKLINLLESHGAIYIKNFMYKEGISPTESECNFFYNILENDYFFCKSVVDSLPYQCKTSVYEYEKTFAKRAVGILGSAFTYSLSASNPIFGLASLYLSYKTYKATERKIDDKENEEVVKEIIEQLKRCIKHKLEKPLNSFDWNKKNYEEKSAKDVLKSIKSLRENVPIRNNSNLMDTFSNYIYENTPLKEAMNKAIEIVKKDSKETIKIIVILSDGESTDGNPNELKYLLPEKNTYIVTFYFTSEKVDLPKQLYFRKPYGSKGLEQLYNLASEIEPNSPIFDLLEERGWSIDYTKKSKLFVKANNIEIFEEFFEVLNLFVNGNIILGDMISKIKINDYINTYNKKHIINEDQYNLPICWCHSLAKVIEYASHRIYRGEYLSKYPYPTFEEIKNLILKKYGSNDGKTNQEMTEILSEILPGYFLRYSSYNYIPEHKIKAILIKGRPLVFTYYLSYMQWENFRNFFKYENKKGTLTKEIVNRDIPGNKFSKYDGSRHAVILIGFNDNGFVCLNSWGEDFGDNGKFTIKSIDVLERPFFIDVFFEECDLPYNLRNAWYKKSLENEKEFRDNYL